MKHIPDFVWVTVGVGVSSAIIIVSVAIAGRIIEC